jgi:hypothetical protein
MRYPATSISLSPTTINPANATKAAPASQVMNATKAPATATYTNATSAKSSAKVRTAATTTAPRNSTTLKSGSKMYPLNYRITGSGNNLNSVSLEKDSSTLASPSHGTLTIELPRNITDSKVQGTNHDQNNVVFEDSQYVPVTQLNH